MVFLDMIEQNKTYQDRLDAIDELQFFIVRFSFSQNLSMTFLLMFRLQDEDLSRECSAKFLALKRDVKDFVLLFDKWIKTKGEELKEQATELQSQIASFESEIQGQVSPDFSLLVLMASRAQFERKGSFPFDFVVRTTVR